MTKDKSNGQKRTRRKKESTKDAFLISRVHSETKQKLINISKELNVSLSKVVDYMIASFIEIHDKKK